MYNLKQILEAIHRGINLALDNFDDGIQQLSHGVIKSTNITKEYVNLMQVTVDLGLPSGTLWCKYNLGVDKDLLTYEPESWYGNYYAWGEILTKPTYAWDNYKFGSWNKLTKYRTNPARSYDGGVDHLKLLELKDDAAYLNMHLHGFKFYIPTRNDFKELINNTTHQWVRDYGDVPGLCGLLFISKINKKHIFFPVAGWKSRKVEVPGKFGYYWSSNLSQNEGDDMACYLNIYDYDVDIPEDGNRDGGMSIRAICKI